MLDRRTFMQAGSATTLAFLGLRRLVHGEDTVAVTGDPLIKDPHRTLDLPEGFEYVIFSRHGQEMDDGFLVPGLHDGMGAFAAPDGSTILVRNHELGNELHPRYGPFGWQNQLLERIDPAKIYDRGHGRTPALGGTTTLVYDTKMRRLRQHFLSCAGTGRNCAGGITPWGSWITCEEWTARKDKNCQEDHGYCFEVPANDRMELATPIPIRGMGRFNHEAIAIDPATGIVYLTEDRKDGLFYRFIPKTPGRLLEGGRLQALAAIDRDSIDTRNWLENQPQIQVNDTIPVRWMDLDQIDSPLDDLRHRGHAGGAAVFARGEGIWTGSDGIYMATTTGGPAKLGQIWKYVPSSDEGTGAEASSPGTISLFVEPNDPRLVRNADNLTIAPWGDLFICEDADGPVAPEGNRVIRVTRDGTIQPFAMSRLGKTELAGICFSPDGSTLFFNMQQAGATVAVTGPWNRYSSG
ncbi:MAG: phosphatase [Phycisphaerae bacterium]|nr:phosphatase [Phycisphaerae bacterium]